MATELATVFGMVETALASLRALSPALSGDAVTFLDVIVTADDEDLVVEAVGGDGESLVPVGRVPRSVPGDAAKLALNHAIARLVSRATELAETGR